LRPIHTLLKGSLALVVMLAGCSSDNDSKSNSAPVLTVTGGMSTQEDTPLTLSYTLIDAENDPVTLTIETAPSHGNAVLDNGTITYTPNADYTGSDTLTLRYGDDQDHSEIRTLSLTISPVNDAPLITLADSFNFSDGAYYLNYTTEDKDGDTVTAGLLKAPSHASASIDHDQNALKIDSNSTHNGADSLTLSFSDGSVTLQKTLNLSFNNGVPTLDTTLSFSSDANGLSSYFALEGNGADILPTLTTAPANGTVNIAGAQITYLPNAGFEGVDSFTLSLTDGNGNTTSQTIPVFVGTADVSTPLPTNARLNTTDLKRAYYFNSTASHLMKAEEVINDANITDDDTVSAVRYAVVSNLARNGIASTAKADMIPIPYERAKAYRAIAKHVLIPNKRFAEAEALLNSALTLQKEVIAGKSKPSSTDLSSLITLSSYYLDLNRPSKANEIVVYIDSFLDKPTVSSTDYITVARARIPLAEYYYEKGDNASAKPYVDRMLELSRITPYYVKSGQNYNRYRALNYRAAIENYYMLGYNDEAISASKELLTLLENDTNDVDPSKDTPMQINVRDVAKVSYLLGDKATGDALAVFITKSSYLQNLHATLSGIEGVKIGFEAAYQNYIETYFDDEIDRIMALMPYYNYGIFKKNEPKFFGYQMVDYVVMNASKEKGLEALDFATAKLDAYIAANKENSDDSDQDRSKLLTNRGYADLASYYLYLGENAKAKEVSDKAKALLEAGYVGNSSEFEHLHYAHMYLSYPYADLNDHATSIALLQTAQTTVDALTAGTQDQIYAAIQRFYGNGYYNLFDRYRYGYDDAKAEAALDRLIEIIGMLDEAEYDGSTKTRKVVDILTSSIENYYEIDRLEKAKSLFTRIETLIPTITSSSYQNSKWIAYAKKLTTIGEVDHAVTIANGIDTDSKRTDAFEDIAEVLSSEDRFTSLKIRHDDAHLDTDSIARVDFDRDGKPDFYTTSATPAQISALGLTLDDDVDNDGIKDALDATPYDATQP